MWNRQLAELLRQRRTEKGLTQQDLADLANVGLGTIKNMERGNRQPRTGTIRLVWAALGYPDGAQPTPRLRLRQPLGSFVGRQTEVESIRAMLARNQLVTLTGFGGAGKSRLALEIAKHLVSDAPDGLYQIEIEVLKTSEEIVQAVADALDVRVAHGKSILQSVVDHLRSRRAVLLLDGCEHLVAACAGLVKELVELCPELRVLVTSREALHLPGENVFVVTPLQLPAADLTDPVQLEGIEAVQLLVERVRGLDKGFELTDANAPAAVEICRRLDGIPLAIELAAARADAVSIQQIARHVADRFKLLRRGDDASAARHQSLRALIDWSYETLDDSERALLAHVSVFAGGCTLEAVETICALPPLSESEVFDALAGLVRRNLIKRHVVGGAESTTDRYDMLESLHHYATDRFHELPPAVQRTARARHRDFFTSLAIDTESKLRGADSHLWLARVNADYHNLLAAVESGLEDDGDKEPTLHLTAVLGRYGLIRGHRHDALRLCSRVLDQCDAYRMTKTGAKLLNCAGSLALADADFAAAGRFLEEACTVADAVTDIESKLAALNNLGSVALHTGAVERARELYETSLQMSRGLGDASEAARVLNNLGALATRQGDRPRARSLLNEALTEFRASGELAGAAGVLANLGTIALKERDYEAALPLYEQSLTLSCEIEDGAAQALVLNNLAGVAKAQGAYTKADEYIGRSLRIRQAFGDLRGVAAALETCASLKIALRELAPATQLLAVAAGMRETTSSPLIQSERLDVDNDLAAARAGLGESAFECAWAVGATMSVDQAIEAALA